MKHVPQLVADYLWEWARPGKYFNMRDLLLNFFKKLQINFKKIGKIFFFLFFKLIIFY